jgi:hypothetical protein
MKILILFLIVMSSTYAGVIIKDVGNGQVEIQGKSFVAGDLLAEWAQVRSFNLSVDQKFSKTKKFRIHGPRVFTPEALDSYVSSVVNKSHHTLIKFPGSNFVKVLNARDVRYEALPVYKDIKDIPKDLNYAQMIYQLKHIGPADLARNLRPFMSRYGRIIDEKYSNVIYVADVDQNLRRIYKIIDFLDTEKYAKSIKTTQELNKKHEKVLKKEKTLIEILSEKEIIFLIIFFILGSIIGFGTRGYLMKRIEGGW